MFNKKTLTLSVAGRTIEFETGQIARQADGAVMVRAGDTMVLVTACASPQPGATADFLGLRVDYQEKLSSCGRTLGGFIKREGRPTERETLVCRLIDRPLRPMFPDGYFHEVQVLAYVLSYDGVHSPEALAICGASAALSISSIPLIKPIAAVRVGMIDEQFIINPTREEMERSRLDLMLSGTDDAILMIEGYCDFLTEEQILEAIEEGHKAIRTLCEGIADWQNTLGKPKTGVLHQIPEACKQDLLQRFGSELQNALRIPAKQDRQARLGALHEEILRHYTNEATTPHYDKMIVDRAYKEISSHFMRLMILKERRRSDGRALDQVRPIDIQLGILPRTHGSALFTRGETQALAVCTLGGESMGVRYEDLNTADGLRGFYLQYSFPPFSVGEVGRVGAPGRREVGHGKLAERSLNAIVPTRDRFPYTIRLESNVTESNGSSSMASVCGGCLALMAAGVPIRRPIAGIAMGLILEGKDFAILSDILGDEDALGDMDFKVAGDAEGITAFQLDIKVEGIDKHIMKAALAQARTGRTHILHKMTEVCPTSKEELSAYAPRIEIIQIKPSKIGTLIGPGGKQIRAIIEESGAQVDINDAGIVSISATSPESMAKARAMIEGITTDLKVGEIYEGVVVSIKDFGAFVKIFDKEGLCHISELAHSRVRAVEDVCKEGDKLKVKVLEINDHGKIRLSHKAVLPALVGTE